MRFVVLLVTCLLCNPALATPLTAQENDTVAALMSWAVKLSSYPAPSGMPVVEFVSQKFFDDHACNGRHCHVWGWYPNTGQNVVYVHENIRALLEDGSDPHSLLAASIIVHEFVHYLQAADRGFARYDCRRALELEREAYEVQREYLTSYGRYLPVGISMHGAACAGSAASSAVGSASVPSRK